MKIQNWNPGQTKSSGMSHFNITIFIFHPGGFPFPFTQWISICPLRLLPKIKKTFDLKNGYALVEYI